MVLQEALLMLRRRLRHITLGTLAIIVLVVAFFSWLTITFMLGDDLIIDLSTNQTSFHIPNNARAHTVVTLDTRGQLFCTTLCNVTLFNTSENQVGFVQSHTLHRGQSENLSLDLAPRTSGSGQVLYSVSASCHNVRELLCPTRSPERAKTLLLTVNYGLSSSEAQLKPVLRSRLESMLGMLQQADTQLLYSKYLLADNPWLRAGNLSANITDVENDLANLTLELEKIKLLWNEESYATLQQLTADMSLTQSIGDTLLQAQEVRRQLLALPARHNTLLQEVAESRGRAQLLLEQSSDLRGDAAAGDEQTRIAAETNSLVILAAENLFDSLDQLQARIRRLTAMLDAAETLFAQREAQAITSGNGALLFEEQRYCSAAGCNATNWSLDAIPDICARFSALRSAQSAYNLTLANASGMYVQAYCVQHNLTQSINFTALPKLSLKEPANITSSINVTLPEHTPLCCVFGECKPCCNTDACKNDASTYPVLFVHGHSFNSGNSPEFSLGGYFIKMQRRLQQEGYVDAGIISPSSTLSEVGPGEWGFSGKPVTARVTYYYNFYRSGGSYTLITQKSENIETYAIRLKELIDIAKHHTGKSKVTIVAHSMGGLVVRRYLQIFGEESVDKVIFIGTPNGGVTEKTQQLCPLFGESKECNDMTAGSVFMQKLNDPEHQPTSTELVTITGHGCDTSGRDGDGVVQAERARLPGVRNYDVNGTCSDFFGTDFHTEMLNIDEYPDVYEILREELRK
jgi:hypothetical protein